MADATAAAAANVGVIAVMIDSAVFKRAGNMAKAGAAVGRQIADGRCMLGSNPAVSVETTLQG